MLIVFAKWGMNWLQMYRINADGGTDSKKWNEYLFSNTGNYPENGLEMKNGKFGATE